MRRCASCGAAPPRGADRERAASHVPRGRAQDRRTTTPRARPDTRRPRCAYSRRAAALNLQGPDAQPALAPRLPLPAIGATLGPEVARATKVLKHTRVVTAELASS